MRGNIMRQHSYNKSEITHPVDTGTMCDIVVEVEEQTQQQRWRGLVKDASRHVLKKTAIDIIGKTSICNRTSDSLEQHQAVNDDAVASGKRDNDDFGNENDDTCNAADVLSEMTFTIRLKNLRGRLRRSSVSMETGDHIAAAQRRSR